MTDVNFVADTALAEAPETSTARVSVVGQPTVVAATATATANARLGKWPLGGFVIVAITHQEWNQDSNLAPPSYDVDYTWNHQFGNINSGDIFDPQVIDGSVREDEYAFDTLGVEADRRWNGLGGVKYLPSFPQLDREETSWPHAT